MVDTSVINVFGKQYKLSDLTPDLRQLVALCTTCSEELQRIDEELTIAATARGAYAVALKKEFTS